MTANVATMKVQKPQQRRARKPQRFRVAIRWINKPDDLYYWRFTTIYRAKAVLGRTAYAGKFEWAAIYDTQQGNTEIERFTYEKGWHKGH